MSHATQPQTNITSGLHLLERMMLSTLTTVPCCIFFINGTMLYTLRSKSVFRETSRYILLYNLLCSDTVQMVTSQMLYLLAAFRVRLTYPVCGLVVMVAVVTNEVSPLTLVVMSLERYVAVCYPLRHAAIITIKNTLVAIFVIWAICLLNVLTRVLLLINFSFSDLESLQMGDFCTLLVLTLDPMSDLYEKAYTCVLFVSAAVVVISSYIGVIVAARSASADKASSRKARNTLLLHLVQLGLSLSSTIHNPILIAISRIVKRIVLVRLQVFLFLFIVLFPRCLSALIYGIRDQTIRPILLYYLCFPLSYRHR